MENEFMGRAGEIDFAQFMVPIWDLVPMTIWERYVYIELCTWSGIQDSGEPIKFSAYTLAEKYCLTDKKYQLDTVRVYIQRSIQGLVEKKVLNKTQSQGKDNRNQYYLWDVELCRKKGWFKHVTKRRRKNLYTRKKNFYETYKEKIPSRY